MCACKPSRLPVCVCACACVFLSRRGCLYIYIYYKHPCTPVHNSIPLLSPFLRLSLFFYFPFLNASVLYTYFPCTWHQELHVHHNDILLCLNIQVGERYVTRVSISNSSWFMTCCCCILPPSQKRRKVSQMKTYFIDT